MCFGREDADALYAAVANGNFRAEDAVGEIDAANAGATVASDKDMIMALIQEQVGLDRFNTEMREYLLKAFKTTVTSVLALKHGGGEVRSRAVSEPPKVSLARVAGQQRREKPPASTLDSVAGFDTLGARMNDLGYRMSDLEAQVGSRMSALESQMSSRVSALEGQVASQMGVVASRMSALEGQATSQMSQIGVVVSRMTGLEEQIAALARTLRNSTIVSAD